VLLPIAFYEICHLDYLGIFDIDCSKKDRILRTRYYGKWCRRIAFLFYILRIEISPKLSKLSDDNLSYKIYKVLNKIRSHNI